MELTQTSRGFVPSKTIQAQKNFNPRHTAPKARAVSYGEKLFTLWYRSHSTAPLEPGHYDSLSEASKAAWSLGHKSKNPVIRAAAQAADMR